MDEFGAQTSPYAELLNGVPQQAQLPPQGFAAMQQPVPAEVREIMKPTNNPVEIEQRKEGWMEVLKRMSADPNLMRAVGMFGAAALQPRAAGQTTGGQLGQAFMVGQSAYDFGKQAEFQRQMAMTEEQRKQEESASLIRNRDATTKGQVLQNEKTTRTMEDAIAQVSTARKKAEEDLKKAQTDTEKSQIQLEYEKRVAAIKKNIPDATLQASFEAEMNSKGLSNKLTQAQTASANASARASGALADERQLQLDLVKNLSDEEKLQFITKTGKYASGLGSSAQVQAAINYKSEWKTANKKKATETQEQYESRASQALLEWLSKTKDKGTLETRLRWDAIHASGDKEADDAAFAQWLLALEKSGGAGETPAGAATGVIKFVRDKDGKIVPAPAK